METEKKLFLQGESYKDVDPKFAETRLAPLLEKFGDLIKLAFSSEKTFIGRVSLFDHMAEIVKDPTRQWELRLAFSGIASKFDSDSKDKLNKAFLTSSEPANILYDELLSMEAMLQSEIESRKQHHEDKKWAENRTKRILEEPSE